MTKFTTLSPHIGDANHLYEVGEPREIDEPGNAQHLFADKVLGPYDDAAEQAWRESAAARAAAEPATKVDADKAIAALADNTSTLGAATDTLTTERDDARAQIDSLTRDREQARADLNTALTSHGELVNERNAVSADLNVARHSIDTLTKERDDVRTQVDGLTRERDQALADLQVAHQSAESLSKERDALRTELQAVKDAQAAGEGKPEHRKGVK